ncbi:MAG: alpha/beta hydrolase, partial [Alphaproteobacteria bacterium]|nr:alpha/beta hydrolase [Alphaproteobacteria bacterium]
MRNITRTLIGPVLCALFLLGGCAYSGESRSSHAYALAAQNGWTHRTIETGAFRLESFLPRHIFPADTVTIYIEGDGLAWLDPATPSFDPTPKEPVGLELALKQNTDAAYLARPCQYESAREAACSDDTWWTSRRFAPEVVEAETTAVDAIKRLYKASHVVLVGYSGGGAIAALVAARRHDVTELVTVAGNLDTETWVKLHGVLPLSGSLNPADEWAALQNIPQRHF